MNILKRAMREAGTPEDNAAARTVALLAEAPNEAAIPEHFSTDPVSGYDAAQIALRLFEGRFLGDFSDFLKEKNLSPNIVLANGLTLLQNSLMHFPKDEERVRCLLGLGANPNLFMRRIEEKGFGKNGYRAGSHPLNYAFANCPQLTTPEICAALREYGASIDGLKYRLEVDPDLAMPDDETKAKLRTRLIGQVPDPNCLKAVRKDVDLSVMQRELANIETQLAAAGFQIVTYVPPKPAEPKAPEPTEIGQTIEGKGVFAGVWEPKDRQGKAIGKKYRVYAAPEDLADSSGKKVLLTFQKAAQEVAKLKNWHGNDGGDYKNDVALYKALRNGSYKGEWFIPTRDLLLGTDIDGKKVHDEPLYKNKEEGDFAGTYTTRESSSGIANWYWSCSEHRDISENVWVGRFSDGVDNWNHKDHYRLSCRPVRVEELVI